MGNFSAPSIYLSDDTQLANTWESVFKVLNSIFNFLSSGAENGIDWKDLKEENTKSSI